MGRVLQKHKDRALKVLEENPKGLYYEEWRNRSSLVKEAMDNVIGELKRDGLVTVSGKRFFTSKACNRRHRTAEVKESARPVTEAPKMKPLKRGDKHVRVYLASPYSHPDATVREQRFDAVCEYAAKLMNAGFHVYSPIAHGHAIARFGLPGDWDFWRGHCERELLLCDAVVVLQLEGWDSSIGVTHEVAFATEYNIRCEGVAPGQLPKRLEVAA